MNFTRALLIVVMLLTGSCTREVDRQSVIEDKKAIFLKDCARLNEKINGGDQTAYDCEDSWRRQHQANLKWLGKEDTLSSSKAEYYYQSMFMNLANEMDAGMRAKRSRENK